MTSLNPEELFEKPYIDHDKFIEEMSKYWKFCRKANREREGCGKRKIIFTKKGIRSIVHSVVGVGSARIGSTSEEIEHIRLSISDELKADELSKIYCSAYPPAALARHIKKKLPGVCFEDVRFVQNQSFEPFRVFTKYGSRVFGVISAVGVTILSVTPESFVNYLGMSVSEFSFRVTYGLVFSLSALLIVLGAPYLAALSLGLTQLDCRNTLDLLTRGESKNSSDGDED